MQAPANDLQLIERKRDGKELSDQQIRQLVERFVDGSLPDYQMSAFAMAVYFQGMTPEETASLTLAMLDSGSQLTWAEDDIISSKHSTGGVGDKVSLVLIPLLASCGLRIPKLSGKGLGITGGTLDKLESIKGFRTDLTITEIQAAVERVGCCITGATHDIAPADRRLYGLRDSTATVPSVPLITSSILSKKLAENPDHLVLDVKFGRGSFMKTEESARLLARSLQATAERLGLPTQCVLSDMNQPLGKTVGNLVEVKEAIEALEGQGESRLMETVYCLAMNLYKMKDAGMDDCGIRQMFDKKISSGEARDQFEKMVSFQGGSVKNLVNTAEVRTLQATEGGFIHSIDPESLGWAIIELGGGRKQKDQPINHAVGCELLRQPGEAISEGEDWLKIYSPIDTERQRRANEYFLKAIKISPTRPEERPVILEAKT
ncbi:MAG: thymidine phosphorylase [Rubripirellula sp.]